MQLKTAREAVNFGLTGSVIGAVSTAGFAWKYSRSLHGNNLPFILGFTILFEEVLHKDQMYLVPCFYLHLLSWLLVGSLIIAPLLQFGLTFFLLYSSTFSLNNLSNLWMNKICISNNWTHQHILISY